MKIKRFIKASFATLIAATAVIGLGSCFKTNTPSTPTQETPTVNPTNPTVGPSQPTVDPTNPTIDPSQPTVDPTNPTTDPTEKKLNQNIQTFFDNAEAFNKKTDNIVYQNIDNLTTFVINDVNYDILGLNMNKLVSTYNSAKNNASSDERANKLYNLLGGENFAITAEAQQKIDNGESLKLNMNYFAEDCKKNVAYFTLLEGFDSFSKLYKTNTDFYRDVQNLNEKYDNKKLTYRYNNTRKSSYNAEFLYNEQLENLDTNSSHYLAALNANYVSRTMNTKEFQELAAFVDGLSSKIGKVDYLNVAEFNKDENLYSNMMNYLNNQGYSAYGYSFEADGNNFATNNFESIKERVLQAIDNKTYDATLQNQTLTISVDGKTITITDNTNEQTFKNMSDVAVRSKAYTQIMPIAKDYVNKFEQIPIALIYTENNTEYVIQYYGQLKTNYNKWTKAEYESLFGPITEEYDFEQTNEQNQNQPNA